MAFRLAGRSGMILTAHSTAQFRDGDFASWASGSFALGQRAIRRVITSIRRNRSLAVVVLGLALPATTQAQFGSLIKKAKALRSNVDSAKAVVDTTRTVVTATKSAAADVMTGTRGPAAPPASSGGSGGSGSAAGHSGMMGGAAGTAASDGSAAATPTPTSTPTAGSQSGIHCHAYGNTRGSHAWRSGSHDRRGIRSVRAAIRCRASQTQDEHGRHGWSARSR